MKFTADKCSIKDILMQKAYVSAETAMQCIEECIADSYVRINSYVSLETNRYKDQFIITIH